MKHTDINDSLQYLGFRWGFAIGGGQKNSCPHASQIRETQSPIYQRSMENHVPGGRNSILNWVLKPNYHFKFFEALNLVFACICDEKDFKVMRFWNIYTPLYDIQVKAPDVVA